MSSGTEFIIKNSFAGNLNEKPHENISNHSVKESEAVVLNYCCAVNTKTITVVVLFSLSHFWVAEYARNSFRNGAP